MSPEAQQKAIAQAVGYYLIHDEETSSIALRAPTIEKDRAWRFPWHRDGDDAEQFAWEDAPDFLNDLNAMHEAVMGYFNTKTPETFFAYLKNVARAANASPDFLTMAVVHATAAQRAEAFLRTIGKWEGKQ